jgi:Ca2+-binding EF-hand superfamily protein
MHKTIVMVAAVLVIAGCASPPPRQQAHREQEWHPAVEILLRYADKNGNVTRAAMEAGLRKDFAAADTNHDGVLEPDEMRAVNAQRWEEEKSAYSPLIDWKDQGFIDFDEYAAEARSLFDQLDRDGNGVLTPEELRAAGAPQKPNTGEQQQQQGQQQQQQGEHGHRGHRGGGQGGGNGGGGQGGSQGGGNNGGNDQGGGDDPGQ